MMVLVQKPTENRKPVIRTVGLDELALNPAEHASVYGLIEQLTKKLCRKKECGVTVHVKAYDHEGNRKKYSVHIKYTAPGTLLVSGKMHDWNLQTAIRAAYRTLDERLQALHEQLNRALEARGRMRKSSLR